MVVPKAASSKYEQYITKTDIKFPFADEWFIASGGRSGMHNHHTVAVDQRFAYDFMIKKNGSYHKNPGRKNEDYHSYNQKVIAPGKGVVIDVINAIAENSIGVMPPKNSGNRVIIDYLNRE